MSLIRKKKFLKKKIRKEGIVTIYFDKFDVNKELNKNIIENIDDRIKYILNELKQNINISKNLENLFKISNYKTKLDLNDNDINSFIIFLVDMINQSNQNNQDMAFGLKILVNFFYNIKTISIDLNNSFTNLINHLYENYSLYVIFDDIIYLIFNFIVKKPENLNIINKMNRFFLESYQKGKINITNKLLSVSYLIKLVFFYISINIEEIFEEFFDYFTLCIYIIKNTSDKSTLKNIQESWILIFNENKDITNAKELFRRYYEYKSDFFNNINILHDQQNYGILYNANNLFLNFLYFNKNYNKDLYKNNDFINYLIKDSFIASNQLLLCNKESKDYVLNSLEIIKIYSYFKLDIFKLNTNIIKIFNIWIKENNQEIISAIIFILEENIDKIEVLDEIIILNDNLNILLNILFSNINFQISLIHIINELLNYYKVYKNNYNLQNEVKETKYFENIIKLKDEYNEKTLNNKKDIVLFEKLSILMDFLK